MRGGLCRRHRAGTSVGLQVVHRDDLLPFAHLDGEGHHLVWAGIWGSKRIQLAVNTHLYALLWPSKLEGILRPLHRMPAAWVVEARCQVEDLAHAVAGQGG
jgi:hypothetical protein